MSAIADSVAKAFEVYPYKVVVNGADSAMGETLAAATVVVQALLRSEQSKSDHIIILKRKHSYEDALWNVVWVQSFLEGKKP